MSKGSKIERSHAYKHQTPHCAGIQKPNCFPLVRRLPD
jgi:hypothetical protein